MKRHSYRERDYAFGQVMLTLRTRIARITPAKLEHEYRIYRTGELLTEARSVLACVDRRGNIQRIPEALCAGWPEHRSDL